MTKRIGMGRIVVCSFAAALALLATGAARAQTDDAALCGTAITAPDDQITQVIGACDRVIPIAKTSRDSGLFYRYRAWALANKGDFGAAIADYDRALAINPDDTWSLQGRAQAHRALGQSDEARDDYLRLEWLKPDTRWRVALEELGLPVEPTVAEAAVARPAAMPAAAPAVVQEPRRPVVSVAATSWRPDNGAANAGRLQALEDENLRLRNLLAEAMLEVAKLREQLSGM
jgi:tetratricopeptide (TPR) repeat protein